MWLGTLDLRNSSKDASSPGAICSAGPSFQERSIGKSYLDRDSLFRENSTISLLWVAFFFQVLKRKILKALQSIFTKCDLFSSFVFWLPDRYIQQSSPWGCFTLWMPCHLKPITRAFITHGSAWMFWERKILDSSLFMFL